MYPSSKYHLSSFRFTPRKNYPIHEAYCCKKCPSIQTESSFCSRLHISWVFLDHTSFPCWNPQHKIHFPFLKVPDHASNLDNTLLHKNSSKINFCICLCREKLPLKSRPHTLGHRSKQIFPHPLFILQNIHLSNILYYYAPILSHEAVR